MYDLRLSPEQLEIRDTVRDFVTHDVKPLALKPERLEARTRPLLTDILDKASQMGLRTLALSEQAGGAGADALTCCIVTEELAAGDPDVAAVLARTSTLAHTLFDRADDARNSARASCRRSWRTTATTWRSPGMIAMPRSASTTTARRPAKPAAAAPPCARAMPGSSTASRRVSPTRRSPGCSRCR